MMLGGSAQGVLEFLPREIGKLQIRLKQKILRFFAKHVLLRQARVGEHGRLTGSHRAENHGYDGKLFKKVAILSLVRAKDLITDLPTKTVK